MEDPKDSDPKTPPGSGDGGSDGGGASQPSTPVPDPARKPACEARVRQIEDELAAAKSELAAAREQLAKAERSRDLVRLLAKAHATDLDAAAQLAEQALSAADAPAPPDPDAAVRDLRRRRPHLFRPPARPSATLSPRDADPSGLSSAEDLADLAQRTGDRRALLRYLRARRAP